ncbi:hypothetical protein TBLA_0C06110 [Henningerozyma blattae CBS 6284]|uniref:Uncharacterized protein n=1 Tax=Henningerozyma blattae (strain ATCC 34711 / CBS 6284 / DSM 70876 / NBRC 10599 / NRRL Y-10934 / UCD 77-7) TaxID=1071380 RepID=I2H205_HENB6|nr:hypothetical protein TBLA_0C06110 [Tetrapisispora blattae CBS 6284]CCH60407.1 hypothetical protein TBLA_0C06110 [Tetrapisispora blattae CBS 6284]
MAVNDFHNASVFSSNRLNSLRNDPSNMSSMNKPFNTPSKPISKDKFTSIKDTLIKESPRYLKSISTDPIFQNDTSNLTGNENPFNSNNQDNLGTFNNIKLLDDNSNNNNTISNNMNIASPIDSLNFYNLSHMSNNTSSNYEVLPERNITSDSQSQDNNINVVNNIQNELTLGSYENPILKKLSHRTINKEFELQKIIASTLILAMLSIIIKFIKLFIHHSKYGIKLYLLPSDATSINLQFNAFNTDINIHFNFRYDINYDKIYFLIQCILVLNILISLWKLSKNVKYDDLKLSKHQMELLGLNDRNSKNYKRSQLSKYNDRRKSQTKPHMIQLNRNIHYSNSNQRQQHELTSVTTKSGNLNETPYLFKSLMTPSKLKEFQSNKQTTSSSAFQRQPYSHINNNSNFQRTMFNNLAYNNGTNNNNATIINNNSSNNPMITGSNLFGNSNNNNTNFNIHNSISTPNTNSNGTSIAYIPSSKYTYMMNTPTPKKI